MCRGRWCCPWMGGRPWMWLMWPGRSCRSGGHHGARHPGPTMC
nr:MAG TPA: hypothetical protein [Caudoviricetes sp.]